MADSTHAVGASSARCARHKRKAVRDRREEKKDVLAHRSGRAVLKKRNDVTKLEEKNDFGCFSLPSSSTVLLVRDLATPTTASVTTKQTTGDKTTTSIIVNLKTDDSINSISDNKTIGDNIFKSDSVILTTQQVTITSPVDINNDQTIDEDVNNARYRMMDCAQEILAFVEPKRGATATTPQTPLINYSRSPRARRIIQNASISTTTSRFDYGLDYNNNRDRLSNNSNSYSYYSIAGKNDKNQKNILARYNNSIKLRQNRDRENNNNNNSNIEVFNNNIEFAILSNDKDNYDNNNSNFGANSKNHYRLSLSMTPSFNQHLVSTPENYARPSDNRAQTKLYSQRATPNEDINDVMRHYGDYHNNKQIYTDENNQLSIISSLKFADDTAFIAYNPLAASSLLAPKSPTISPASLHSLCSIHNNNNAMTSSMSTSAYSSRSAKSEFSSLHIVPRGADPRPSASSLTTPTSTAIVHASIMPSRVAATVSVFDALRRSAERLNDSGASSGCVTPNSFNSLVKPDSSLESSVDGGISCIRSQLIDETSPTAVRSASVQHVPDPQKSMTVQCTVHKSSARSCFSLDGANRRRGLLRFTSASTSTTNFIEMQNATVVEWLHEKAAVRLAELFHAHTVRVKTGVSAAKWKLMARFDIDLLKGVRNAVKNAKIKALSESADASKVANVTATRTSPHDEKLYGMSLSTVNARINDGVPLPHFIRDMMVYIAANAASVTGVFRKNGVKGRIQEIRDRCSMLDVNDALPEELCVDSQLYNLADAFKQYLRDLPECLMTKRVSAMMETSINELPESKRLKALHYCVLLLPSENREALMVILRFLHKISDHSAQNQMSAENLATCLMPSLFYLPHTVDSPATKLSRRKTIGVPSERERNAYNALKEALTRMIRHHELLLTIPTDLAGELRMLRIADVDCTATPLQIPLKNGAFDLRDEILRKLRYRLDRLKNNHKTGWKEWKLIRVYTDGTRLYTCDTRNYPLAPIEFMVQAFIETSANRLHALLLHDRQCWDYDVNKCQRVGSAGQDFDIIEVTYGGLTVQKRVYLARRWTYGGVNGSGISSLVERSIVPRGVRDTEPRVLVFKSDFLIAPDDASARSCQLTYLSRIDLRGKPLSWYNRVYGELMVERIRRLRSQVNIAHSASPSSYGRCSLHQHNTTSAHIETIV